MGTYNEKGGFSSMKINTKMSIYCTLALAMIVITTFAAIAQAPDPKEETVYVVLQPDGNVKDLYVVNAFELTAPGMITDYGTFSEVRNMSTKDEIRYEDGKVSVTAPAGRFYYQGNMVSKEIPWIITIRYFLDQKEIHPDQLAGKSGAWEVSIDVKQNPASNRIYFENYTLQISMALHSEKFSGITADEASITNAGKQKNITFTLLPKKEKHLSVKANVSDFESTVSICH
jgi:hypothetical protein